MAVTKIWPVKDSISRVIDYCNNPEKTKFTDLEHVIKYASNEEKVTSEQYHEPKADTGGLRKAERLYEHDVFRGRRYFRHEL